MGQTVLTINTNSCDRLVGPSLIKVYSLYCTSSRHLAMWSSIPSLALHPGLFPYPTLHTAKPMFSRSPTSLGCSFLLITRALCETNINILSIYVITSTATNGIVLETDLSIGLGTITWSVWCLLFKNRGPELGSHDICKESQARWHARVVSELGRQKQAH